MTLRELKARLGELGSSLEEPMLEARVLLMHLGFSQIVQITEGNAEVSPETAEKAIRLMEKRASGYPMAYITGEKEFWGLAFHVDENVLIPRPDTETLVETALGLIRSNSPKGKLLDLCTGSGAIATAVASTLGRDVAMSDISPEALKIAKDNYTRILGHEPEARLGDLLSPWDGERFSAILTNPPYLTDQWYQEVSEDVKKEPEKALVGFGDDGLDLIRRILVEAPSHLEKNGWIIIESDYRQCKEIAEVLEKMGFADVNIVKDLRGKDRVTYGRYTD